MKAKPCNLVLSRWLGAVLVTCVSLGGVSFVSGASHDENNHNQRIASAVEEAFWYDSAVPANNLDVTVFEGTVTLTGQVPHLLARERAIRTAESIKGVQSIIDRMSLAPSTRTDQAVRQDVFKALATDPATDSYEMDVTVKDNEVQLTGTVDSLRESMLAETVAKRVRGVRSIDNQLTVDYPDRRPDSELAAEIRQTLKWNTWVDHRDIEVKVRDGKVTMTGTVGSMAERRAARRAAYLVGIESIDTAGLRVREWDEKVPRRAAGDYAKDDEALADAIEMAWTMDPRVFSFRPSATVEDGVVTLRGVVDNLKAKQAAEQDARNTLGVRQVKNYIKVRTEDLWTDKQLEREVTDALRRDIVVDRYEIDVKANYGVVYLNGTVDSFYEKSQAEQVTEGVPGVVSVFNNLQVDFPNLSYYNFPYDSDWYMDPYYRNPNPGPVASDWQLRNEVERELFWSPFVDESDIEVRVSDGEVVLTGEVESWSEYFSAEDNAREAGAVLIDNNLTVDTSS